MTFEEKLKKDEEAYLKDNPVICSRCGKIIPYQADDYYDDMENYDAKCFRKIYPTDRDWNLRICDEMNGYHNELLTMKNLKKLTDQELNDLAIFVIETQDSPCYYTTAE